MTPKSYRIPEGQHNNRSMPGIYDGDCGSAWQLYMDILVVDYDQGEGLESMTYLHFYRDASSRRRCGFNSSTDGFRLNPRGDDLFGFAITAALRVGMSDYTVHLVQG